MFSRGPKTGEDSRFGPGNNEDNNKIIVLVRSKKYRRRFTKKNSLTSFLFVFDCHISLSNTFQKKGSQILSDK